MTRVISHLLEVPIIRLAYSLWCHDSFSCNDCVVRASHNSLNSHRPFYGPNRNIFLLDVYPMYLQDSNGGGEKVTRWSETHHRGEMRKK